MRKLAEPTVMATGKRVPGLKLDHPRLLAVMHALVRFANIAAGSQFTTVELYPFTLDALGCSKMDPQKVQKLDAVDQVDNLLEIGFSAGKKIKLEHLGAFAETAGTA